VEQIGYVYEGLLERTVKRTTDVTLELDATKGAQSPWVTLAELESARLDGTERLVALLRERSGSSESRIRNDLTRSVDDALAERLLTACHGDTVLRDRVRPFAHLLRTDPWGYPLVHPAGAYVVTTGSDRRETGTHYTPKSLTEAIVAETLTPVAYVGPAEGKPCAEWVLRSPEELLDLKVCDPAMGSGAFLVQACRWLADRLVEAWARAEAQAHTVGIDGRVAQAGSEVEPLPRNNEERTLHARRLVAERCLYGVDLNPLAVELAKLSLWLVTLAKERPFGFLDHNLRCGDSLLGIHRLDQLTRLTMNPSGQGQMRLFGQSIERAVREVIELRQRLRETPIRDIRDVEVMAHLDADARQRLEVPGLIADAFIGEVFAAGGSSAALENALASLAVQVGRAIDGDRETQAAMRRRAAAALATDLPAGKPPRRPFHWPLEFPEVFADGKGGFDAMVGNPPFMAGKRLTTRLGESYTFGVKRIVSDAKGAADLCAYFFIGCSRLTNVHGAFGLIATNSISQGDTREVGLGWIESNGWRIIRAWPDLTWPGGAAVTVSPCVLAATTWRGEIRLSGKLVSGISSYFEEEDGGDEPRQLKANEGVASIGTGINGEGFILTRDHFRLMIAADRRNAEVIRRYLTSQDINQTSDSSPTRYVIDFWEMPEHVARTYEQPFARVTELVKPQRDRLTRQIHETCYWKHWDRREAFYRRMRELPRVIVTGRVSKHHIFTFADPEWLMADGVVIFLRSDEASLAVLHSSIHAEWVQRHKTTMRLDTTYSVSRCFLTFPWPEDLGEELTAAGRNYLDTRSDIQFRTQSGLTSIYNRFHDELDQAEDIRALRLAHQGIDMAVASSYGIFIPLEHGFHDTKQGRRFTISPAARRAVIQHLLRLNRIRFQEEFTRGLHGGTARTPPRTVRAGHTASTDQTQPSFNFEAGMAATSNGHNPATTILGFLGAHDGWHAKSDILAATGITDGQWNAAIADLLASGRIERRGERRGARYRAVQSNDDFGERS